MLTDWSETTNHLYKPGRKMRVNSNTAQHYKFWIHENCYKSVVWISSSDLLKWMYKENMAKY